MFLLRRGSAEEKGAGEEDALREPPPGAGRGAASGRRAIAAEEGFRFEGPGRAAGGHPEGPPARLLRRPGDDAPAHRCGVRSLGAERRLGSLKAMYREEYAELAAEAWGQGELL